MSSRLRSRWPERASVPTLARRLAAEVFGTFTLVFAGCGAIMVDSTTHALGHLGVALSFGLVIMAMIYAVGHVSGAHFNPAVTLGFALSRHFPWPRVGLYWGAQAIGAIAAALLLRASLGNVAHVGATLPSGTDVQSFLWETVLTVFLMFVIMAVATDTRAVGEAAAIAVGGTVGLDALFGGPISGASMNPARSLGPALVSGDLHSLWIYLTAPFLGAVIGVVAYQLVRGSDAAADGARARVSRVLFVCIHNAGRSQMAAALLELVAGGRHEARSAGSDPGEHVHPEVVDAMGELGVDLSGTHAPPARRRRHAQWADVVITWAAATRAPYSGKRYVDRELTDPKGTAARRGPRDPRRHSCAHRSARGRARPGATIRTEPARPCPPR